MNKECKAQNHFMKKIFWARKQYLISLLSIIIVSTIISSINPYIYGEIIDSITGKSLNELKKNLVIFLLLVLVIDILSTIEGIIGQATENLIANDIKRELFNKILVIKYGKIKQYMEGELLNRLEFDAEVIIDYYIDLITSSVMIIFNFTISLYFIIKISTTLSIISVFMLPVSYFVNFLFRNKIRSVQLMKKECDDKYYGFVNEILGNISGFKIFNLIDDYNQKYKKNLSEKYNINIKTVKLSGLIAILRGLINNIFDIAILFVSAIIIFSGKMTIGNMVAFNTYLQKLFEAVKKILDININRQNVVVSDERIKQLLNQEVEVDNGKSLGIENEKIYKLEFSNVFFQYSSFYVLRGLNLKICKNGLYTIAGKNGSGKSTMLRLIEGLYNCTKGSILVNEENIQNLDIFCLRKEISYMAKEPFLVNDTIVNNLKLGSPYADMQQIEKVCKKVLLHEDIMLLNGQYQTLIGESGYCLSSGQKQKLGMARILLRNSSLILLDEVTSDLDGKIEQIFCEIVKEMSQKAIVLNISHDRNMMEVSDYIMVLYDGHIVSSGKHEELLINCMIYSELFKET